ncbi:hypothetical protein NQZ68_031535 [Dissostichus eleginoides]|nr:hypothetical protein NQZ68_031535 [Dissostichus eleginoides]
MESAHSQANQANPACPSTLNGEVTVLPGPFHHKPLSSETFKVSHNQIFPAGQRLKRSFLSPSSGTQAIELAPGIPPLRWAMGQCFAPPCPGPPSFSQHTCTPKPYRGNLLAASAT